MKPHLKPKKCPGCFRDDVELIKNKYDSNHISMCKDCDMLRSYKFRKGLQEKCSKYMEEYLSSEKEEKNESIIACGGIPND